MPLRVRIHLYAIIMHKCCVLVGHGKLLEKTVLRIAERQQPPGRARPAASRSGRRDRPNPRPCTRGVSFECTVDG